MFSACERRGCLGSTPATTFYFLPSDIVTQVLNFGLPAPVDIQIEESDIEGQSGCSGPDAPRSRARSGIADARIQQAFGLPRVRCGRRSDEGGQGGYTQRDVANSVPEHTQRSFQITPMFFLNSKNGVNYNLVTQTPQY